VSRLGRLHGLRFRNFGLICYRLLENFSLFHRSSFLFLDDAKTARAVEVSALASTRSAILRFAAPCPTECPAAW
jgi:hypothetical protein